MSQFQGLMEWDIDMKQYVVKTLVILGTRKDLL